MFREPDNLFVPLDDILHCPISYDESVFRLYPSNNTTQDPVLEEQTKPNRNALFIAIVAVTTYFSLNQSYVWVCSECILNFIVGFFTALVSIPKWFDKVFVEQPLEIIYR